MEPMTVVVLYTNHRGETRLRTILPLKIYFGNNQWHPKSQWLMEVFDAEKCENRIFALAGIKEWGVTNTPESWRHAAYIKRLGIECSLMDRQIRKLFEINERLEQLPDEG